MRKIFAFILIFIFIFLMVGCSNEKKQSEEKNNGYSVVDDSGRSVYMRESPQRIISLTYGTDEILSALVNSERIIGYSRWAADPEISFLTEEEFQKVGQRIYPNIEQIMSLNPDLVLVSVATDSGVVRSLEEVGIPVYVASSPHNYNEMCEKVLGIARVVNEEKQGIKIVNSMNEEIKKIEKLLSKIPDNERKVVIAFNFTAAMGRKGGLFDNMLTMAHIVNGVALRNNTIISKEEVVNINPDIFLLPTWNFDNKQNINAYAEEIKNDPAYKNLKAVKNNQIKFVPDKYKYVASQHIVESIKNLQKQFIQVFWRSRKLNTNKKYNFFILFFLFLLMSFVACISLTFGQIDISVSHVFNVLGRQLEIPLLSDGSFTQEEFAVLWHIRIPRILVGLLVGASLGISGAVMQGIFSNPLADPGIIGISAGAATGAVISIALGVASQSLFVMPAFAFCGSICAVLLTVFLAMHNGRIPVMTLLLAGVAVGMFLGAVTSGVLTFMNEQKL